MFTAAAGLKGPAAADASEGPLLSEAVAVSMSDTYVLFSVYNIPSHLESGPIEYNQEAEEILKASERLGEICVSRDAVSLYIEERAKYPVEHRVVVCINEDKADGLKHSIGSSLKEPFGFMLSGITKEGLPHHMFVSLADLAAENRILQSIEQGMKKTKGENNA